MALTFLEIVQQLADELDYSQPSTVEGSVSTQVRRMRNHVNRAYNYIWLQLNPFNEEAELSTSFNTVSGTASYAIPTTLNSVDEVKYGNEPPMRIYPWAEFQQHTSDYLLVTQTGAPTACAIRERKIYLFPTPDAVYSINVRGKSVLTELDFDTDTPALRDDFQRVIFEWALYFQMVYENNPMMQAQLGIAQQALQVAKNNSRNHNEMPSTVMLEDELRDASTWRELY